MANRILLADDSITIQKVVNLTFADEGIEVVTVSNGDMAERRMSEVNPDLVLADIFMPGKNGYELCQYVKENPDFKNVPVVLLVGAFEPFDQSEARRVKADAHLTKPFESRTLVETVRNLIEASKPARQATTPTKKLEHREKFDTKPLDPFAFQSDGFQLADPIEARPRTPDFGFNPREAFGGTAALEDPLSLDDGQGWVREAATPAPVFEQTLSFEAPAISQFAAPQPSGAFAGEPLNEAGAGQALSFFENSDPFAVEPTPSLSQPETGSAYDAGGFAFVEVQAPDETSAVIVQPAPAVLEDNPLDNVLAEPPSTKSGDILSGTDFASGMDFGLDSGGSQASQDFVVETGASFEIVESAPEAIQAEPPPKVLDAGTADFAISHTEFGPNGSSSSDGFKDGDPFDATPIIVESSTFSAVEVDFETPDLSAPVEGGAGFEFSTESSFVSESPFVSEPSIVSESRPQPALESFDVGQGFEIAAFTTEAETVPPSSAEVQFTTSDMWSQPETHFAPAGVESAAQNAPKPGAWQEPAAEIAGGSLSANEMSPEAIRNEPLEPILGEGDSAFTFMPAAEALPDEPILSELPAAFAETAEAVQPDSRMPFLAALASTVTESKPVETPAVETKGAHLASLVETASPEAIRPPDEGAAASGAVLVSKAVIDEIVRRVVSEITESVVKEIAWEVVPDAVERVIERMTREQVSRR